MYCLCRLCAPQHIRWSAAKLVYVMSHQAAGTGTQIPGQMGGSSIMDLLISGHACAVCHSSIAPGLLQKQHAQQRQHVGQELRQ